MPLLPVLLLLAAELWLASRDSRALRWFLSESKRVQKEKDAEAEREKNITKNYKALPSQRSGRRIKGPSLVSSLQDLESRACRGFISPSLPDAG